MRILATVFVSLTTIIALGQNISVKTNTLGFPDTDETSPKSEFITVYNNGSYPVSITDVDLFRLYGDFPFMVSDTAFTIYPADSFNLNVDFAPEHNIYHDMALVLKTETGFGHLILKLEGQGEYSNNYYSSTENLSEEALKLALNSRLNQGYTNLGYNGARDNMYATIDNVGGTVECVYTGRTANFTTRTGANNNSFNCEHTFPQSFFSSNEPMKSDIFHLFPTDVSANSTRSNHPFGVVNNPTTTLTGGSKYGNSTFEPRDAQKGQSARAMMYFVIRYQDYSNFFQGQENILRQWHNDFPPQSAEINRNSAIYSYQNNRNPFIDYPQFEERISSFVSNSVAPVNEEIYISDDTIKLAQGSGNFTYTFVIYNSGNEEVDISDLALSGSGLSFTNAMPDSLIAPGAYYEVMIDFDASQNYTGYLSFDASSSSGSFQIPIESSAVLSDFNFDVENLFTIYPNPAEDYILIENWKEIKELIILNATGMQIKMQPKQKVDLADFRNGIYYLKLKSFEGNESIQKLILN